MSHMIGSVEGRDLLAWEYLFTVGTFGLFHRI